MGRMGETAKKTNVILSACQAPKLMSDFQAKTIRDVFAAAKKGREYDVKCSKEWCGHCDSAVRPRCLVGNRVLYVRTRERF